MFKPTVLVIVGPTASGKSALAVKLAKKFDGEVISADSRQVYRGLNIGTGKITKKEMDGVPHHLLDVASPKRVFTVAQYQKLAKKKIAEIIARGKLPIIVGGTGFYIQAVVDDLALPQVPPNPKLRAQLGQKKAEELFKILEHLDPARAKKIDKNNPRRLIRAIEIASAGPQGGTLTLNVKVPPCQFILIGLNPPPEKLKKMIKTRLEKRLKMGLIAEVERLRKNGLSWKRLDDLGLEYRYVANFLRQRRSHFRDASEPVSKRVKREEMISALSGAIWHYAKRQLTWFKRDERIRWLTERSALKLRLNRGSTNRAT